MEPEIETASCNGEDLNNPLTPERKSIIDEMSHKDLCLIWKFSSSSNPLLFGLTGAYLRSRIIARCGFLPLVPNRGTYSPCSSCSALFS